MYYWLGVAFGIGVTLFYIGLEVIPIPADNRWFKYGGAALALSACIAVYYKRKHTGTTAPPTQSRM